MLLTDTDIIKLLGKEIVIEPFSDDCLTPVGYDLRVGDFVYSLSRGLLSPDTDGKYTIKSGESILILTQEFVWVSDHIGGTFHSKVSMVSKGFSHIGTTLDPRWSGPLLIATSNRGNKDLTLSVGQSFVTLLFYRTKSRATRPHQKPPARRDILLDLLSRDIVFDTEKDLNNNQRALIEKVSQTLHGLDAQSKFSKTVEDAGKTGIAKVTEATKSQLRSRSLYYFGTIWRFLLLIVVTTSPIIFEKWLKPSFPSVFGGVSVDTTFFVAVLGAVVTVTLNLFNHISSKNN